MSVAYRAVLWNRQKKIYDSLILAGIALYLVVFLGLGFVLLPGASLETRLIRGLGTCALLLLHVVLSIGPLARLDSRFLPLLYNRRHLGVATFLVGLAHGGFSLVQFHVLGDMNPLLSVLVSNGRYDSLSQFPFQALGLLALGILFLMAATSHDFWLANLTAPVWKALHMAVYVAYASLVLHVALGALQSERHPGLALLLGIGMVWIFTIHLVAAQRERRRDQASSGEVDEDGYVRVCVVSEIPENRAHVVCLSGERVAVFRYDGKVSAVSNVCKHQNGPLGEGKIIDGCITCPWHGYQYLPHSGASPPPFKETVPTFRVRVEGSTVWVHPHPHPPGTELPPAVLAAGVQ